MSNVAVFIALVILSAAYGIVSHKWWLFGIFAAMVIIIAIKESISSFAKDDNNGIPLEGRTWSGVNYERRDLPSPNIMPNELNRDTYHSNGWTWQPKLRMWINDKTGEHGWYE